MGEQSDGLSGVSCRGSGGGDGLAGPWVRRMRLVAALLRVAMTCGPPAVRGWWRSSSRVASWIRWRRFSVPRCPWTQVSHRPGVGLSGGRGAGQVDDLAGALLTGRAGSGAPGGGAGAPDLEDLGGCGEVGPGRGGGLGAHGVGGDHGPVQAEGLDRLGQGGDLVGPVRHLALGQDRSGGVVQGRQQVRGGLVAATGAAHGPAVHRDEPASLDCQGQPQHPPPSPRTTPHPRKHTDNPHTPRNSAAP